MTMTPRARLLLMLLALPLLHGCFAVIAGGAAAGADAAHDRRTFHTVVDDRNVQLTALDLINRDQALVRDAKRLVCPKSRSATLITTGITFFMIELDEPARQISS